MPQCKPVRTVEFQQVGRYKHIQDLCNINLWLNDEERTVIIRGANHVQVEFDNEIKIILKKDGNGVSVMELKQGEPVGGGMIR